MKARDQRQQRLRAVREFFGYTVEEVAEAVGVSPKTVYRYETGTYKTATENIQKVCHWYSKHKTMLLTEDVDIVDFMKEHGYEEQ